MDAGTWRIRISGQVQGVGFRPCVHGLAAANGLKGVVYNDAAGVVVLLNGTESDVRSFLKTIVNNAPAPSVIQEHYVDTVEGQEFHGFHILPSDTGKPASIPLTTDFAICEACKAEIRDPGNRRYRYPFTTCVHCGPRFAITREYPFERAATSMAAFPMCERCTAEYTDPSNRRFHSQTNSCPDCGIHLKLTDPQGSEIDTVKGGEIALIASAIRAGKIVAIKNTSGYLLCCDARNAETITELRKRKRRPTKPFAVLFPDIAEVMEQLPISPAERMALTSPIAPITVVDLKANALACDAIAPGLRRLGAMLPSSALLQLLMDELGFPVVATSGNIHGSPIIATEAKALELLHGVADLFLHHDLNIEHPQDDSVITFTKRHQHRIILRRSRGMAPNYLLPAIDTQPVLAMGAQMKACFAYIPNGHLYVSPYFGDLGNAEVSERYGKAIDAYVTLFQCRPARILADDHPGYRSVELGAELSRRWNVPLTQVQHHKAHFASVLGEHGLFNVGEKVLGVVWDGTGLGEDSAIWGGEFFLLDGKRMERVNHFQYFPWIAGDKMAREPRLSLLSLASEKMVDLVEAKFSKEELRILQKRKSTGTTSTSSVGRLFDAAASLLGLADRNSFEGEAAMLLEAAASRDTGAPLDLLAGITDTLPTPAALIQALHEHQDAGAPLAKLAHSFIHALAVSIFRVARQQQVRYIACSGGIFQNALLTDRILDLAGDEFDVRFNDQLSPNDENIAFGQLMYQLNLNTPCA